MKKMQDNKGFTLIELLIVVAIIGIIAAIAIPGLLRARQSGNEASAIGSVRAMNSANATFASSCASGGYAISLEQLSLPPSGGVPFIGPDLAVNAVIKSGYTVNLEDGTAAANVTLQAATCNNFADSRSNYYAHAEPVDIGGTGQRSFGSDNRATLYQNVTGVEVVDDMSAGTVLQ